MIPQRYSQLHPSRQHQAPLSLVRPLSFELYSSSSSTIPVVGADASGFEVINESNEYDNSLSAFDISETELER